MTATGELREALIRTRDTVTQILDELDDAVRLADALDDEAINAAADRFVSDHRNTGGGVS